MVAHLAQRHILQLYALAAGRAVPPPHHHHFAFPFLEDLGRAAADESVPQFVVVEAFLDLDTRHQAIEASGNW